METIKAVIISTPTYLLNKYYYNYNLLFLCDNYIIVVIVFGSTIYIYYRIKVYCWIVDL